MDIHAHTFGMVKFYSLNKGLSNLENLLIPFAGIKSR